MLTAVINSDVCVGCGICLEACPFDAIIGTVGQMHTVLVEGCIGCKLCINPCPVDCIELQSLPEELITKKKEIIANAKIRRAKRIARDPNNAISIAKSENILEELKDLYKNTSKC